jgi:hypothetical protein
MKTLISFPRSGAHWLMALVDMSVNHKVNWQHLHDIRLHNSWEIPKVADFKDGFKPILTPHYLDITRGSHDHDIDRLVFLYRKDLPAVVYSFLKMLKCSMTKENVLRMVILYYDYMKKWKEFISKNEYPSIVVTYEDLSRATQKTLDKILEFYDFDRTLIKSFDAKKIDKQQVCDHISQTEDRHSPIVDCSKDYLTQKREFLWQFGSFIDCLSQNRNSLPSIFKLGSTKTIEYDYEKCS